jgi:hypothetical protein
LEKISNILKYVAKKDDYMNDYEFIYETCKDYLVSLSYCAYRPPFFILADLIGIERLATVKSLYIDMTWFKNERGIIVLSEKIYYDIPVVKNGENSLHSAIRSIP